MESTEAADDQLIVESGVTPMDCALMSSQEKKSFASAIKASKKDINNAGSPLHTMPDNSGVDECTSKPLSPKLMNNALESNINISAPKRPGNNCQNSRTSIEAKDNLNPRNATSSSTSTKINEPNLCEPNKNNENGVSANKTPSSQQQENIGNLDEKENIKVVTSNIDVEVAKSPGNVEEELLPSLIRMVFEKQEQRRTSHLNETRYPPFTLSREEWIKQMGQYFLERKMSRIKSETRDSKWITLSEKTYSTSFLERAAAKSPTTNHREDSPSSVETRSIDADHEERSKVSPEPSNNLREDSPEAVFSKESTNWNRSSCDTRQPEMTDATGTSTKQGNSEGFVECASEANEEDVTNELEHRGKRNKRKTGRHKNSTKPRGAGSCASSPVNDDNSKLEQNTREVEPYEYRTADYPPLGRKPNASETQPSVDGRCPLCDKIFPVKELDEHAWNCHDKKATEPETKQVAANEDDSGSDNDVMEVEPFSEQRLIFQREGQNETDGCSRSSARIRSLKRAGGEWLSKVDRPSKNLRK